MRCRPSPGRNRPWRRWWKITASLSSIAGPSACSFRQGAYEIFEDPDALLKVFELVEAGAGRRKQDGIAGGGDARGLLDRCRQGAALQYQRGVADLGSDFLGGRANEQCGFGFGAERRAQHRIIAIFIFAAQDDPEPAGERIHSFESGVDTGGLGIVVVGEPVDFLDEV